MMQIHGRFALLLTLIAAPLLAQQRQTITITGVVVTGDHDRTPVKDAVVLVRDYQQPSQELVSSQWQSKTAADGSFSFSTNEDWQGCYDIFVSANARFLPSAERVCLQAEHPRVLKIVLKADPHASLRLER